VKLHRSSGVFLHPTSLPRGRLDEDAYGFVDWLEAAGQSWWQVLPLGPPDELGSPYRATSAFAASPLLLAEPDAPVSPDEVEDFVVRHPYWIGAWAQFAGSGAVADQVRFEREWTALREYARARGVRLIGDVPLYVSDSGADVQAWPELFAEGEVAGAPPDALSATGQRWGNPLYDWPAHRTSGYRWWIERFRRTLELVELSRVDHFRGFVAYWSVRRGNKTARHGRWLRGPGASVFEAVCAELGTLDLVAEDLGVITAPVVRLRRELGLPGMVVLQFQLGGGARNPHRPENHREQAVVYTGTHDNDTAIGWWESLTDRERAAAKLDAADPAWSLIEQAWRSRAALAITPLQDVLRLGGDARMNLPGSDGGANWHWRYDARSLTAELAQDLRALSRRSRRG
jgi:4-alpha-glucanotransferase